MSASPRDSYDVLRISGSALGGHGPGAILIGDTSPGTTGFDVVGSWGWLRVEVPGGLVKHPGTNKCEVTG